jgi:hypothetical protein
MQRQPVKLCVHYQVLCGCAPVRVCVHTGALIQNQRGFSLVGRAVCLCQYAQCAAAAYCCHVLAAMLACCSVLAVFVVFSLLFVPQGCSVNCHLEVKLATRSVRVQVWRQAWGVAGTSPPHTVLVH